MVQLVVIYCMIANANVCKETRPTFEQPLNLMSCMTNGQQTAAEYVEEHPLWRMAKFRCEVGVPKGADL
jgi:hypothetical protein